jgi:hypothetical protein
MDRIYQHFIDSGLSPDQARANAEAAANALPLPFDIPNYTAPGQVDTFGDTAVEMMREPWAQAKADWSQAGPSGRGLLAGGSAGLNTLLAGLGGGAGLLSEAMPDFGGRGADNNELAFARDFMGFGDAYAGAGIGRGMNALDDLADVGADGLRYAGLRAGDAVRRSNIPETLRRFPLDESGMFLGPSAANADIDALKRARELSARRRSPDEVWNETGWFKGADDKWRFEISDDKATLRGPAADALNYSDTPGYQTNYSGGVLHQPLLGGSFRGQEYKPAYNFMADMDFGNTVTPRGSYDRDTSAIEVYAPSAQEGLPIALHELQHAVQAKEGFAPGSNPDFEFSQLLGAQNAKMRELSAEMDRRKSELGLYGYQPKHPELDPLYEEYDALMAARSGITKDDAYQQYIRTAGEVESNNVMNRRRMTAEERMATPPWLTQDFPYEEQIVRDRPGALTQGSLSQASIEDQVAAARKAVMDSPNDENLFLEYKRLRKMRDEGASTFSQAEAPAPQVGSGLLGDYVGQHRAPTRDAGAPAFSLAGDIYPDDIYSSRAVQYYGTGSDAMDKQTMGLLQSLRGKPDADVTIYRAVPKGVDNLNAGDWVTVNKQYAEDHGESALGGDFDIIEEKVKAKDIFTNGDSIHEFGYDPATPAQEVAGLLSSGRANEVTDEMLAKFAPKDEMEMFDLYQRGATGMDLPMDEASRMARATDMGFDTGTPLYHGTGSDFQAFDPARFGQSDHGLARDWLLHDYSA